jgi:hypothetical protein
MNLVFCLSVLILCQFAGSKRAEHQDQVFDATVQLINWKSQFDYSEKKQIPLEKLRNYDDEVCQNQLLEYETALARREM